MNEQEIESKLNLKKRNSELFDYALVLAAIFGLCIFVYKAYMVVFV